jgi:predicted RNA polymerase sigma factor
VAQRIVRAKKTLSEARVPFEVPRGAERTARLSSVLEVIYLIFDEGYAATAGEDWVRPALCDEALRLGRILAGLVPDEPEVLGLVALMEIQASRLRARVGPGGEPVLLLDQDRSRWDHLLIRRGLAALSQAEALMGGGAEALVSEQEEPGKGSAGSARKIVRDGSRTPGPYAQQAAIAACHARAGTAGETDWPRIAGLYDTLARLTPSPVVELNRGVAHAMAHGPAAGLEIVDRLRDDPVLEAYHLLPSVRGDLLVRLGRLDEARAELERAASLTRNARERRLLLKRAAECAAPPAGPRPESSR